MVTSFDVAPVAVNTIKRDAERRDDPLVHLDEYKRLCAGEILQKSPSSPQDIHVAASNGFIIGVVDAYNGHHNLEIRPDDVWIAIMTQFGHYVNGNADEMRRKLVNHEGKVTLSVDAIGMLRAVDYGKLSERMIQAMKEYLFDSSLIEWVIPEFSTTTAHDLIVGSVVLMASMKQCFSYKINLMCGIPSITLHGTVQDWENIRNRLNKLAGLGKDLDTWATMLGPILDQFVQAAKGNVDSLFWQRICHFTPGGSGPSFLSGWISTFCVVSEQGKWQGSTFAVRTWNTEIESEFPIIDMNDIPSGYQAVDVIVDDNGTVYNTLLFAGHTSYAIVHGDTIAPKLNWAIALKT